MAKKTGKKPAKGPVRRVVAAAPAKPVPKTAKVVGSYTPKRKATAVASASTSTGSHTYVSLWAPTGCTQYSVGKQFVITVAEPPDEYITVDMGSGCNPVFAQLDE